MKQHTILLAAHQLNRIAHGRHVRLNGREVTVVISRADLAHQITPRPGVAHVSLSPADLTLIELGGRLQADDLLPGARLVFAVADPEPAISRKEHAR